MPMLRPVPPRPVPLRPVPPHVPKRRLPMAPVGREIAALTRKAFARFGFADDHVLTRWREIVGPELARLSAPERISRPQPTSGGRATSGGQAKSGGQAGGGSVLTVRVAGAAALELQHMAPEIIARINRFYGRPAIVRLKLVQGPLPEAARPPRRRQPEPAASPPAGADGPATAEGGRDVDAALARLERAIATADARPRANR